MTDIADCTIRLRSRSLPQRVPKLKGPTPLTSRRSFFKAAVASGISAAAAAPGAAGCGPAAAAGGSAIVRTVANTAATAYALELATKAADGTPSFVKSLVDEMKSLTNSASVIGAYIDIAIPDTQLKVLVSAMHNNEDGEGIFSTTLHHLKRGSSIRVPSILQLGINLMCLNLAGAEVNEVALSTPASLNLNQGELEYLRDRNSIYSYDPLSSTDELDKQGIYQASTVYERQIRVSWFPSDKPSQKCNLLIQKGEDVAGREPSWDYEAAFAIPYRYIFEKIDTTNEEL
ncbi:hypothetical protein [Nocardia sp. NPDC057227]|uniref:hypothetical protein n=1 Tax=Nocardia sp. NPDC057227 TaxID=3346056 RepID=UPI003631BB5D